MNTNKEIKAAIVKTLSLKASQVSVSSHGRCGSSTVRVNLTDSFVSLAKVEAIAKKYERVSRCEATGDILSGGNHFVSCSYGHISADLQTLLWALFDTALEMCGECSQWYAAQSMFSFSCEQVVKAAHETFGEFKDCTREDFMRLAHEFAQESVMDYWRTGKRQA